MHKRSHKFETSFHPSRIAPNGKIGSFEQTDYSEKFFDPFAALGIGDTVIFRVEFHIFPSGQFNV